MDLNTNGGHDISVQTWIAASDIGWLRNYDLAHMTVFYSISIYITYAFEVERLKLALSFSMRLTYYALKAPTQHETSIAEAPTTGTCEV